MYNQQTKQEKTEQYVYIEPECLSKLDWVTTEFKEELQIWLGGEVDENGDIIIDDLLIPHHTGEMAHTDVKGKELAKMRKEYGDRCKRIIGQFHSHNTMGCFWSVTDDNMQKKFSSNSSSPFCVFIVGSNAKYLTRIMIKTPFKYIIDDVTLTPLQYEADDMEEFKKDVKKKVTIVTPSPCPVNNNIFRGYNYNNFYPRNLPPSNKNRGKEDWYGYDWKDEKYNRGR